MKTKRDKRYTPKPKPQREPEPFDPALAMLWEARKKSRKRS